MTKKEQDVLDAARAWRETPCSYGAAANACVGENHLEDCAAEVARQDLLAALNALDMQARTPLSTRAQLECEECDPSFGCFGEQAPCRKLPLRAELLEVTAPSREMIEREAAVVAASRDLRRLGLELKKISGALPTQATGDLVHAVQACDRRWRDAVDALYSPLPCSCPEGAHEPTQNHTSSPGFRVCALGWPIR